MIQSRHCEQCGAELPPNAPEGLCPKCLLKHGVGRSVLESLDEKTVVDPKAGSNQLSVASDQLPRERIVSGARRTTDHGPRTFIKYFGDYELLEEIARGGMGVVYKARQVSLNRIVAVKMILAGQLASEAEMKRFRTEAEAAANLQHPNIVAIHEVGEHEGQQYFSMDYVAGKNLSALIAGQPMPAARAAQLAKTLAEAVHFAHQRGTLHRDLKPQNVLMDEHEQPRITDFGLAKQLDRASELTHSGAVMGSPSYMSPEQAAGRHDLVGLASDVYSLGAILYEMLTGQAPFKADAIAATLRRVVEESPVAPRKHKPEIPSELETICLKCLEKEPPRRYPTARELAAELERFLNQEPILARPISAWRRTGLWTRRHPWVIAGAASFAVLGLLMVVYGLWGEIRYLTWIQEHPDYVRKFGPRAALVHDAIFRPLQFFLISFLATQFIYLRRSRRLTWGSFDPAAHGTARIHPVASALRRTCYVVAAGGMAYSVFAIAQLMDTYIWENWSSALYTLMALCAFSVGRHFAWQVYSEQRRVLTGLARVVEPEKLSKEEFDPICTALFAGDTIRALKIYRHITRTRVSEAMPVIQRFALKLYEQQPEKFAFNPALPRPLDWKHLLFLLAIQWAVVIGLAFALKPERGSLVLVVFLGGWMSGLGGVLIARTRPSWLRLVLLMTVILAGMAISVGATFLLRIPIGHPFTELFVPMMSGVLSGSMVLLMPRVLKKPERPKDSPQTISS